MPLTLRPPKLNLAKYLLFVAILKVEEYAWELVQDRTPTRGSCLRRRRFLVAVALVALTVVCYKSSLGRPAAGEPSTQPDATMTVHADRPGIKISPTLYGIFFEEINRAGEGGLYGEMVQNRSFEDSATEPASWSHVKSADGEGAIAIDASQPLNENNTHTLRIDAKRGRVGAANDGF